ncbi:MAG TPA: hypothetical protein QF720_04145 [Nitrospinota bacterium]|jgi:hypothetical protein|nr:hypothetical protein [Nitrospinota bacterium]|tara:strand:- start:23750 stop:23971 length:222 start_codon:yes stop_codon:yes gene_type:complete
MSDNKVNKGRPWYSKVAVLLSIMAETSIRLIKILRQERLGMMVPLVVLLVLISAILAFLAMVPAIAPFVYPLF